MKSPAPIGPVVRVSAALLLSAACFQVGRWTGQLETRAATTTVDAGNAMVSPSHPVAPAPKTVETPAPAASGSPAGTNDDVITPLNVRDPSALVMGPGATSCPAGSEVAPPAVPKPLLKGKLRKEPLPEGKLLDLMKKNADKPDEPKVY